MNHYEKDNFVDTCMLVLSQILAFEDGLEPENNRFRVSTPYCGLVCVSEVLHVDIWLPQGLNKTSQVTYQNL